MFLRMRYLMVPLLLLISWVGWNTYCYFFDATPPQVTLVGIDDGGWYAGDIQCIATGSDAYKVADISVWLDNKPLVNYFKINATSFEYPFVIPGKTIPQGKHSLKVEVRDGAFHKNICIKEFEFFVDNVALQAAFVRADNDIKVFQGRTLHLQFQVNKEIKSAYVNALSRKHICVPEAPGSLIYECFIPVDCEENPNEYLLSIEIVDRVGAVSALDTKFQVVAYPFKKQNLNLSSEKIKKEDDSAPGSVVLEAQLAECAQKSPASKLWQGSFYAPIDIKSISTDFGTVRTTQHRGRYSHNALDVLGTPRCVVWATQDGVVVIKDRYAHSGNTVVIDHGCGILSLFFHLDSFAPINVGDKIKKGNPVGTLGMTGYASGYHLHWEMRINNIAVDPMQWTKHGF